MHVFCTAHLGLNNQWACPWRKLILSLLEAIYYRPQLVTQECVVSRDILHPHWDVDWYRHYARLDLSNNIVEIFVHAASLSSMEVTILQQASFSSGFYNLSVPSPAIFFPEP